MKKIKLIKGFILPIIMMTLLTSCNTNNTIKYDTAINISDAKVNFRHTASDGTSSISNLNYNENWFSTDSYTYNKDLAKISLSLALASADQSVYDTTNKTGDKYIKETYSNLGFSLDSYYSVGFNAEDDNSVALSLATKNIKTDNDEEFTLLSGSIRGIGYGSGGWKSNTIVGSDSSYHEGFNESATYATTEINNYIKDKNLDLTKTKIWLVGYSRGAAVTNITSINLGSTIDRKNIYTYAFATPAYLESKTKDESLNNIFNIVNDSDLVPMVLPASWGALREGVDVVLPSISDTNKETFNKNFLEYSGIEYSGEVDYSVVSKTIISMLTKFFPTRSEYVNELEPSIVSLFNKDNNGNMDFSYIDNILNCEGTNKDALTIETLMVLVKALDFTNLGSVLTLLTKVSTTLSVSKEYWQTKDSYNDELITKIEDILDYAIGLYMGSGTSDEILAFSVLKEAISLKVSSPLIMQHYGEYYLAKISL